MIEVEVRAEVNSKISDKLYGIGAKKVNEYYQKDKYFMFQEGFIFRIRNDNIFTIKGNVDKHDNGWYEWESKIDNANLLEDVLLKCGFKLFGVVNKRRVTYSYNNFEINVDDVEGLGKFIEVELMISNKKEGLKRVNYLLKKLGIKKVINKGYINIIKDMECEKKQLQNT